MDAAEVMAEVLNAMGEEQERKFWRTLKAAGQASLGFWNRVWDIRIRQAGC
jgi:hypothetical protein